MSRKSIPFIFALCLLCFLTQQARAIIFVQVQGLSDMNLPTWGIGDPAVSTGINFCIYSTLSADYSVTVSSSGGYKLQSGAKVINYTLSWDDSGAGNLGSGSGTALTNNVAVSGRKNANFLTPLCLLGPNARLNLKITQAEMTSALAGTYTGVITIMISPN